MTRFADELLALPGARTLCARHLRRIADALEQAPAEVSDGRREGAAAGPPVLGGDDPERLSEAPQLLAGGDGLAEPAIVFSCAAPETDAPETDALLAEHLAALRDRCDWLAAAEAPQPSPAPADELQHPPATLPLLAERMRLKARACAAPGRSEQAPQALVSEARRLTTRLWMLDAPPRADAGGLARLYEAAADAADLLHKHIPDAPRAVQKRVVDAASHASSLLAQRIAQAQATDSLKADPDARDLHAWLRHLTYRHQIYQERCLTVRAMAPPDSFDACRSKLDALAALAARRKEEAKLLRAVCYHAKQLIENVDHAFHEAYHRERLVAKICKAGESGLPASHRDLRELLLPAYDFLPRPTEALPAFYASVLAYLDQDAAAASDDAPDDVLGGALGGQDVPADSPLIAKARSLVAGRTLYLVGGVPVPRAAERLRQALGLREVLWPQTRAHQSPAPLRAAVARQDVAAVVQLIRYSSHCFGDLREDCRALGKPFVRVADGYGLRSIAYGLVGQASQLLGTSADAAS
ncbi:MAG: hypothetical protein ACK41D_04610 [Rubricoccaceae bacterium]